MTHLDFDRISELAEAGVVNGASRDARHLAECDQCRETHRRLQALLSATRALPRDVAPPPGAWDALRARISANAPRRSSPRWMLSGRWLAAAAAVVLLVGSAIILPFGPGEPDRLKGANGPTATPAAPAVARVERHYASTLDELRQSLDTQRAQLSSTTARVVESSLATIDTAIAETREALASDPGNPGLVDLLSSHYERKVNLLQRATELAPSS